jgi:hypothetical protein
VSGSETRLTVLALGAFAGSMNLAAAPDREPQTAPITVVEQKGASREDFPVDVTTDEGVWLGFRPVLQPARPENEYWGSVQAQGTTVNRVVTDVSSGFFFGYRLTAVLTAGGRVRIEVGPLPADFRLARLGEGCSRCPPFTPLSAALVRYPEPQVVEDGGAFTFELLRNPKTFETLSDFVRVRTPKPEAPLQGPVKRVTTTGAPSERFRVDLALRWDTSNPDLLVADVHIIDLRTGKEMNRALLPLARQEDSGQLRFGGMSPTGGPLLDVHLQVHASRSLGTVVYTLDVREGADLVHAENVTLPYPKR